MKFRVEEVVGTKDELVLVVLLLLLLMMVIRSIYRLLAGWISRSTYIPTTAIVLDTLAEDITSL